MKRSSALQKAAGALPSVETSLDEFIARANATLLDASNWDTAEKEAKAQDLQRREADQQRWKAAEQQLHESEVREQSLRRQLDGLQGRLAEAEARAAVAGSGTSSLDGVIADLKLRLQRADERARAAEARSEQLSLELASKPAISAGSLFAMGSTEDAGSDERVRVAEAKAAKAIAAAKAAAAGLNVTSEIAAIESGLAIPDFTSPHAKKSNAAVIGFASLLVGAAAMFAVTKLVIDKDQGSTAPAPAAQVQPAQPQAAPAPAPAPAAAPAKPVVTPIEEPAPAPQPAAAEQKPEPAPAPAEAKTEPAPAPEPKKAPAPAPVHHAAPAAHHAAPAKAPAKPASEGTLADPFASGPAPAPAKKSAPKAEKKPANGGAIVDPF